MTENNENNLIYEIDGSGRRVLVKSIESNLRAYIRFTNRTSRPVDVWWRDFRGIKRHYVRLPANTFSDINTFITHPWEFTDVNTKESYVIYNKPIFRSPRNIGGMMYRTNWNITISVRSLRKTTLLYLAMHLTHPMEVNSLGLPFVLAEELEDLMEVVLQISPRVARA